MEYLEGKKKIVMVGLNPTEEAKENKAVFSIKKTFWKILEEAKVIKGFPDDLLKCAEEIFGKDRELGYADLVPECTKKKSSDVKISPNDVPPLLAKIEKTEAEKVVLLGHKVAEAFVKPLGLTEEWEEFKKNKQNYINKKGENKECIKYGLLGQVLYQNGNNFKVYVMPFPETAPVPEKSTFYKKIL